MWTVYIYIFSFLSAALIESRLLLCGSKPHTLFFFFSPHTSHPLTSTLIASIIYRLDRESLVMIGHSCPHVLLTVSRPGTGGDASPWLRETWLHSENLATVLVVI